MRTALTGSVYYWDIQRGRIVRIDDGTATPDEFMPNPPAGNDGNRCVGCHAVSNSGRYMAGRLGGGENIGAVFDLTVDLTGDPPPVEFPIGASSSRWWFSSWSPDDTRLVVSQNEGSSRNMGFLDPFTGAQITPIYIALAMLSVVVAAIGLLRDNFAILIGAMVIAPVLARNAALALATTLGDVRLAQRAIKTNAAGTLAAGAIAVLIVTCPHRWYHSLC